MTERDLPARIKAFVERHAKIAAAWEPGVDPEDERFNGPDPALLMAAAEMIERGEAPIRVHSEWGSGCYRPAGDADARAEHDALVAEVNAFILESGPCP